MTVSSILFLISLLVPDSSVICVSRPQAVGSPTRALLACGWSQWDCRGAPDELEPPNCLWAVRVPLQLSRTQTWRGAQQPDLDCLTSSWGVYPRCQVKCPSEIVVVDPDLIFADGFESGDISSWVDR